MPLNVDHSRPFRSQPRRMELINGVLSADGVDENGWVEWKSTLDLSSPSGQFIVARAILSFANRTVSGAHRYADGTAYIIVGASHDNDLQGVHRVDDAALRPALVKYLGSSPDMVEWDLTYEQVQGVNVLVVTVEAPVNGMPAMPLQREFADSSKGKAYPNGTIFVRDGTRTRSANAADVDRLFERHRAGLVNQTPQIDVEVTAKYEDLYLLDFSANDIRLWLAQRKQLLEAADRAPSNPYLPRPSLASLPSSFGLESVPRYIERCKASVPESVICALTSRFRRNAVDLVVMNPGDLTVRDAELRVELSQVNVGAYDRDYVLDSPFPERRSAVHFSPGALPGLQSNRSKVPGEVRIDDQRNVATFYLGDLRPRVPVRCEAIVLAVWQGFIAESAEVRWSVTGVDHRGVLEGIVHVPVRQDQPLTLLDLLGPP